MLANELRVGVEETNIVQIYKVKTSSESPTESHPSRAVWVDDTIQWFRFVAVSLWFRYMRRCLFEYWFGLEYFVGLRYF